MKCFNNTTDSYFIAGTQNKLSILLLIQRQLYALTSILNSNYIENTIERIKRFIIYVCFIS